MEVEEMRKEMFKECCEPKDVIEYEKNAVVSCTNYHCRNNIQLECLDTNQYELFRQCTFIGECSQCYKSENLQVIKCRFEGRTKNCTNMYVPYVGEIKYQNALCYNCKVLTLEYVDYSSMTTGYESKFLSGIR